MVQSTAWIQPLFSRPLRSPNMLVAYATTAGETVSGGLLFGTMLARLKLSIRNTKLMSWILQCFVEALPHHRHLDCSCLTRIFLLLAVYSPGQPSGTEAHPQVPSKAKREAQELPWASRHPIQPPRVFIPPQRNAGRVIPHKQTVLTMISGSGSFTAGTLVFLYFFLFFSWMMTSRSSKFSSFDLCSSFFFLS